MRRMASVAAILLAASLLALLSVEQTSAPDLSQPTSVTIEPGFAADLEDAGAIEEVKCRPGSGHGISYVLDGERHCFKAVTTPTVSDTDTTSWLGSGELMISPCEDRRRL